MINKEQIKKIIVESKATGYNIGLRDISYILLCERIEDKAIAYKALFGADIDYNPENVSFYDKKKEISFLRDYITFNCTEKKATKKKGNFEDISFDENKAYMLKLKKDTEKAMKDGEIEKKDGLKILTDLSVKLNDKFNVTDSSKEQLIFVNAKYDSVCPRCGVEVSRRPITKEEAIEMYNLTEKL